MEPSPPTSSRPTREYRAAVTFVIGASFILIILLLSIGAIPGGPPVRRLVTLAGAVLAMLALFAGAWGLAQRAAWASAVVTPMLVLLIAGGAISFVQALARSAIELPLGAILAIWALFAPPAVTGASLGARGAVVLAVVGITSVWALPVIAVTQPGGPLIVAASALAPALEVTCEGAPGRQPTAVPLRYDWQWLRAEPWVAGEDVLRLDVFPSGPDGPPQFALGETGPLPAGIWQSDISIFVPLGMTFGIDLATTGFTPGSVGFSLNSSGNAPGHGTIDVRATYVHGPDATTAMDGPALWRVRTDARCEW